MGTETEDRLKKWYVGEITLTPEEVEQLRAQLLRDHQKKDQTPHSFWWERADEDTPGWLYRVTAEKLIADLGMVSLLEAAGDLKERAWLRLSRMDLPGVLRITWGKKKRVYVTPKALAILTEEKRSKQQ